MSYSYDGALLTGVIWSGAVAGSIQYSYDNDLALVNEAVPCVNPYDSSAGCQGVAFGYDDDKLLTSAGSETLTHDAQNGLLTGTTVGVVSDAWTYNSFGEPLNYTASVNGTPIFTQQYTRDDVGRITQKSDGANTTNFTYDTAGRLSTVANNGTASATYTYDENSNRLGNGATYDDQDRLLTYGDARYTYTASGEVATKTDAQGPTSYDYDELGNLTKVAQSDGMLIEYIIDAQNRRVGKKVNGTIVQRLLYGDQLRPAVQLDDSGNVVARFVYGSRANVPDLIIKGDTTYRVVSDHLGSPRLIVNSATGEVAEQIEYDEFGDVLSDSSPGFQPFGFAGGLYDPDTKLIRFGARDYDPATGRWTAKDPILFEGMQENLFAYAAGDPVNSTDPSGLRIYPPGFIGPVQPGDMVSRAGTPFPSADAAARAALSEICATSVDEDREYGGRIYLWDQFGPYYYSMPIQGGPSGIDQLPLPPQGSYTAAPYHSHPNSGPGWNVGFSWVDKSVADAYQLSSYIVTPSGAMLKYHPDPQKHLKGRTESIGKCSCH